MGIFSADTRLRWLAGVREVAFMVVILNPPLDEGFWEHLVCVEGVLYCSMPFDTEDSLGTC